MFVWPELHQVYQRTNFQKKSCHPWPGSTPDTSLKTNGYPLKVDLWKMIHFLSEGGFLFKVKKFGHFRTKKEPLKKLDQVALDIPNCVDAHASTLPKGNVEIAPTAAFEPWILSLFVQQGCGKVSSKSVANVLWTYSLQNSRKGWIFGFWATRWAPTSYKSNYSPYK